MSQQLMTREKQMIMNAQHVGIGAITSFHSDDPMHHMAHTGLMTGPGAGAANQ